MLFAESSRSAAAITESEVTTMILFLAILLVFALIAWHRIRKGRSRFARTVLRVIAVIWAPPMGPPPAPPRTRPRQKVGSGRR